MKFVIQYLKTKGCNCIIMEYVVNRFRILGTSLSV